MNQPQLNKGASYTFIALNGFAATSKTELIITGFDESRRRYTFKMKGKRKEFYLAGDLSEQMIFEGHDLPMKVDTETNKWAGNACFNFVTDTPDELRPFLKSKNINPLFKNWGSVTFLKVDHDFEYQMLFPEDAAEYRYNSAPVDQIMETQTYRPTDNVTKEEEPPAPLTPVEMIENDIIPPLEPTHPPVQMLMFGFSSEMKMF